MTARKQLGFGFMIAAALLSLPANPQTIRERIRELPKGMTCRLLITDIRDDDRWRDRKEKIAAEAARLANKMAGKKTLNRMAIKASVKGDITQEDFEMMKNEIADETKAIQKQISALDPEQTTMKELTRQAEAEMVDLVAAWNNGNVNQRQEWAKSFFPEGLVFSHEREFFEPANTVITEMVMRWMES